MEGVQTDVREDVNSNKMDQGIHFRLSLVSAVISLYDIVCLTSLSSFEVMADDGPSKGVRSSLAINLLMIIVQRLGSIRSVASEVLVLPLPLEYWIAKAEYYNKGEKRQ